MKINLTRGRRRASLPLSCEGGRPRGGRRDRPRRTRFGGREKQPGAQFSKCSALGPPVLPRGFALAFYNGAYGKARVCMDMSL
jgi:hypothetical protein